MISYQDLKVGLPSVLSCIEMALFSVLHLYAFPYKRYVPRPIESVDPHHSGYPNNGILPNQGGLLGSKALVDAMNPWDLVKCFARAVPWLLVGRKNRESDISYKTSRDTTDDKDSLELQYGAKESSLNLHISDETGSAAYMRDRNVSVDEGAGLIAHAQTHPVLNYGGYIPAKERYDANGRELSVPFQGMPTMVPDSRSIAPPIHSVISSSSHTQEQTSVTENQELRNVQSPRGTSFKSSEITKKNGAG